MCYFGADMELLVADVTAVGSPDIAERNVLEVIFAGQLFLTIQAVFVV